MITEKDINWKQNTHWSFSNSYITVYRDNRLMIERHATIKRTKAGTDLGKAKEEYFIDGVNRTYKTIEQFLTALNKQHEKA